MPKAIISDADLARIAEIARLKLTPEEKASFKGDANRILDYFSQISAIAGKGKENYYLRPGTSVLREDEVSKFPDDSLVRGEFGHQTKEGLLKAPKNL